jgi:hypothetical protein
LRKFAVAFAAASILASPGAAKAPARVLAAISADLKADEPKATPARIARGLRAVDVDRDGTLDYLFTLDKIPGWCGSGGCRVQLWLNPRNGRPRKVFDRQVRETLFRTVQGRRIVDFDLHGSACHTFGAAACPASFTWDARAGRLTEHTAPNGDGVIRLLAPIEDRDGTPPRIAEQTRKAALKRCEVAGVQSYADAPLTVPDIDGDGLRDWVIPEVTCDAPENGAAAPRSQMAVFASRGRPQAPVLAALGGPFEISVASAPATVFLIREAEGCDAEHLGRPKCKRVRLRWDPASGRLRE